MAKGRLLTPETRHRRHREREIKFKSLHLSLHLIFNLGKKIKIKQIAQLIETPDLYVSKLRE